MEIFDEVRHLSTKKGIYRPVTECRMKINEAPAFCPVCQRALERLINFYTEK